jgi:cytochrome c oxidase cbb3-type subunit 1
MSAILSPSQLTPAGSGKPILPVSEIDASCRVPVLLLFVSAAIWLLISSVFEMIAMLNFHSVHVLASCPCFTYGRIHPAQTNTFLYGFAASAGLGVMLWLIANLGRARLAMPLITVIGAVLWQAGLALGILGILGGDNTGFEWLELPRYASVTMFLGYICIGLGALVTLHQRREQPIFISLWFVLAALFWFPWIYSTANLLLVAKPVRGALQAGIDWWYANNLATIWFGFIGLAAIFYFIPKVTRRPLQSHYLGVFIFCTLALTGSWGGIPPAAPLPAWMPALSTMGSVLTVVPILAVAMCVRGTMAGDYSKLRESRPFKFILFGVIAYIIGGLTGAAASLSEISKVTNFTWFVPAQSQFVLYGFFAMTMFGAIYYIVPRLLGTEFCKPGFICLHFTLAALGILFYALPLAIGGIVQGQMLNDPANAFQAVTLKTLMFLRVSTLGDLLMALGHIVLLVNLFGILLRVGRTSAVAFYTENTRTLEVAS